MKYNCIHTMKLLLNIQYQDKEVTNGGSAPRILSIDDYFMVEKRHCNQGSRYRKNHYENSKSVDVDSDIETQRNYANYKYRLKCWTELQIGIFYYRR